MSKRIALITALLFVLALISLVLALCPDLSFADGRYDNLHTDSSYQNASNALFVPEMLSVLNWLVTTFFLPAAIISAAWRILAGAIVGGIMGMDPWTLRHGMADDGVNAQEVKILLFAQLKGFLKGCCWIGGFYIIFEVCVTIAAILINVVVAPFQG